MGSGSFGTLYPNHAAKDLKFDYVLNVTNFNPGYGWDGADLVPGWAWTPAWTDTGVIDPGWSFFGGRNQIHGTFGHHYNLTTHAFDDASVPFTPTVYHVQWAVLEASDPRGGILDFSHWYGLT